MYTEHNLHLIFNDLMTSNFLSETRHVLKKKIIICFENKSRNVGTGEEKDIQI